MKFKGYERMLQIVGPRYAECWFTNYQIGTDESRGERKDALDKVRLYAQNLKNPEWKGRNLILMGACGTGKDHLAVSVIRAAFCFGMDARYVRGSVLCSICRQHLRETAADVPEDLWKIDLLVISDVEPNPTVPASEFEERALMEVIDRRYGAMLPTVVTSNTTSRSSLAKFIGQRTVDRLFHDAVVVPMLWTSYRAAK